MMNFSCIQKMSKRGGKREKRKGNSTNSILKGIYKAISFGNYFIWYQEKKSTNSFCVCPKEYLKVFSHNVCRMFESIRDLKYNISFLIFDLSFLGFVRLFLSGIKKKKVLDLLGARNTFEQEIIPESNAFRNIRHNVRSLFAIFFLAGSHPLNI